MHRQISGVILLLAVLFFYQSAFPGNHPVSSEQKRLEVYSKLKCCDCRTSFDKCTCTEEKEMKAYIDALLENNLGKEEIFYKVAKKFSLNTILDEKIKKDIETRLIKEAGAKRPQIVLAASSFDFGKISKKKGKVNQVFRILNQGNAPLIIKQIWTSCPCTLASLKVAQNKSPYFAEKGSPGAWQAEIKPQESADLELVIDLASPHVLTGKLIREATIINNDPVHPKVTVRVEAEVINEEIP